MTARRPFQGAAANIVLFPGYCGEAEEKIPRMASNATGGIVCFKTMSPRDEIRASEPDMTTALFWCVS